MGSINFESFNAVITNIESLNREPELVRLGLNFQQEGSFIYADGIGNVANYIVVLSLIKTQLTSGELKVKLVHVGEEFKIIMSPTNVTINGENITHLVRPT